MSWYCRETKPANLSHSLCSAVSDQGQSKCQLDSAATRGPLTNSLWSHCKVLLSGFWVKVSLFLKRLKYSHIFKYPSRRNLYIMIQVWFRLWFKFYKLHVFFLLFSDFHRESSLFCVFACVMPLNMRNIIGTAMKRPVHASRLHSFALNIKF